MSQSAPRLLVVDDDPAIRRALAAELGAAGYACVEAGTGREALELFGTGGADLVVTDLAMPDGDGFSLIQELRRLGRVPILVVSVRGVESDKVRALDLGADDYVTKPFSFPELLARIRAQLRRSGVGAGQPVLDFDGLTIDRERRRVVLGDHEVRLTPTEFAILELLATHAGRPVTIGQIIGRVWRGAPGTTPDVVRVHVGSMRRKIEPDPSSPRYVVTEPWVGYRFVAEPRGGSGL